MSKFRIEKFYKNDKLVACDISLIDKVRLEVIGPCIKMNQTYWTYYNPYAFYHFSTEIFKYITDGWEPPARFKIEAHHKLKPWFKKRISKLNGKKLYNVWLELLDGINPFHLQVAKKLFAANWSERALAGVDVLTQIDTYDKFILNDIINYRPAAQLAHNAPYRLDEDWMEYFGTVNRSLRRTLANYPPTVSWHTTAQLHNLSLTKPLLTKAELVTVCASTRRQQWIPLAMRASVDKIREAGQIWKGENINIRKTSELLEAASFITDYPEMYGGDWVGLARRSQEWHNDLYRGGERFIRQFGNLKDEQTTREPPIPLPINSELKFLDTVGSIRDEGRNMHNCVGAYAQQAYDGNCYLFHAEKDNERATIEVSSTGKVRQSYGPCNCTNKCSEWAFKVLEKWGKSFP
jgi:hypothetical protein